MFMTGGGDAIAVDHLESDQDGSSSQRFPPISKQSANFNQEDMLRSLDHLADLAEDINNESGRYRAEQKRKKKITEKAVVRHQIQDESNISDDDDSLSRAF